MKRLLFFVPVILFCFTANAQVKTIRGQIDKNDAVRKGNYIVEVFNRSITVEVDTAGFFVLQNVSDDDVLLFYKRGDRNNSYNYKTVAQVKHTVLSQSETPLGAPELAINRDTLGVVFLSDSVISNNINIRNGYDYNYRRYDKYPILEIHNIRQKATNKFEIKDIYKDYKFNLRYAAFADFATVGVMPKTTENQSDYTPSDFYRTGISFGNTLDLMLPAFSRGATSVSLGQKRNNSPIPNADYTACNALLAINNMQWERFKTDAGAMFRTSNAHLAEHGANLATLQQTALTYPVTAENPFDLAKSLFDCDKQNKLNAYLKTNYSHNNWSGNASLNYSLDDSKRNSQNMDYLNFNRNEQISSILANTFVNYKLEKSYRDPEWNFYGSYAFNHISDKLLSSSPFDEKLNRNSHNLRYGANFRYGYYNYILLDVSNQHYFSNTLNSDHYVNLFPEFGFKWKNESILNDFLENIFDYWYSHILTQLRGKISRSVGETDLFYRNYAPLSTNMAAKDFRSFAENRDISSVGLKPEIYLNREIGFELLRYYDYRHFTFEFNYFNNITKDLISSYFDDYRFKIDNIGALQNYGYYFSVKYEKNRYYADVNYRFQLNFSRIKSVVTDLYGNVDYVRIGGFNDVAVVAAKGESLGAIYGKTYRRDAAGAILTDGAGNPLINNDLQKLGDPTPDGVLSLVTDLDFMKKRLNFSFTMKYSIGGDRLNGTRAALEHYGISGERAVGKFGSAWQTGVFEEYIEKASYFSLPDISVSYYFIKDNNKSWFQNVKLTASLKNLVVAAAYKGVVPNSQLFGYPSAAGLDFFNLPNMRNYTLSLVVDL